MSEVFVLLKPTLEYNDEGYFTGQGEAVFGVYATEAAAQADRLAAYGSLISDAGGDWSYGEVPDTDSVRVRRFDVKG